MRITIQGLVLALVGSLGCAAHAATDLSAQAYNLYSGDFNGDGVGDILFIAKDPSQGSGILSGPGPNYVTAQSWPSNYLGIAWSNGSYVAIVGDFNGDGKTDILMQRTSPGDSYLLLADAQGHISGITQTIASNAQGLGWTADQHKIIAGDFNGDGHTDLFLQATSPSGLDEVVLASASGTFTAAAAQSWSDSQSPGGFKWSTQNSIVYAGDFNGDGKADLLIQARPTFAIINYTVPFPVPVFFPNSNGVIEAQSGTPIFSTAGVQAWSTSGFGVNWSPLNSTIVVGHFASGNVAADGVLIQPEHSSGQAYFLTGNTTGSIFSSPTAVAGDVVVPADTYKLLAIDQTSGSFSNSALFAQALLPTGSDAVWSSVTGTLTPVTALASNSFTYGYDALGRLTSVTYAGRSHAYTTTYTYDAAENRTSQTTTSSF